MIQGRLWEVVRVLSALASEEAARAIGFSSRIAGAETLTREQARAQAVRRALEELGPFYVKIGQMLSTRSRHRFGHHDRRVSAPSRQRIGGAVH